MINYRRHLIGKPFKPFILKVNSGADSKITIPTSGGGYNYDLRVQGGQSWYGLIGNHTINFPSANTDYIIEISGEFPRIYINNNAEKDKFLEVMQCGDIEWKSLERSFYGASNLTWSATDIPNIQPNCSFYLAFLGTKVNPATIKQWAWVNFSNINGFMQGNTEFNQDISNVDLTNINNATNFIVGASSFKNAGQRLILDWHDKSLTLGAYPFNNTEVLDIEFYGAKNLTWANGWQSGGTALNTQVFVLHDLDRDIDLSSQTANNCRFPYLTGGGVQEFIDSVDKSYFGTLKVFTSVYTDFETHVQGLGYADIADYLLQTNNNWTVIS